MRRSGARPPLPPGSVIGIVGGGQLGRMLALAAARLGFDVAVIAREDGSPAGRVSGLEIVADYGDLDALRRLASVSDVVTFEFENLSAEALERLADEGAAVFPPAKALLVSQDRGLEKAFLNDHGLKTADYARIETLEELGPALIRLGAPALLKTRREGYDGKGQAWIDAPEGARTAFASIGGRPAVLEARVDFEREISVIAARNAEGAFAVFPIGENRHEGGVLRRTLAPADIGSDTAGRATGMARTLLEALDYVGVLGLELFMLPDGALLVNEFAPRVHNSGHWTLDGCEVDQFEQHVRAVAGWPLGTTRALASVEMINLLGEDAALWGELAADPTARLWLYGKREEQAGRKMGHVNRLLGPPRA